MIEANLDYHLAQGVDFVIATDNRSEDRTPEILSRYERQGLLHLIHEPADDYSHGRWVTRMARLAATDCGADWVINCDADEFWWPKTGTLKEVFSAIPERFGMVVAPSTAFVPRPHERGFFADRMDVREVGENFMHPKVAHRARADVQVRDGNHSVDAPDLAPVPFWHPIHILHFPLRTYAQFENKVRKGGRAAESNPELPPKVHRVRRALYRLYLEGGLPDYYASKVMDDDAIEAGLRDSTLRRDKRLKRFLAERRGVPSTP